MSDFIMQMRPLFEEEEKRAVCEYMDEDGFITEFKRTEKFEHMIAKYTGAKHCVVVNNGTISLTLAALAVGIEAGDEVIVPNYTMIATPNSLKLFGANPVFIDVEPETLCLDIDLVKKAVTSKTKAIMLVSANGRYPASGIKAFEELCKEKNLILIEDSAQSLGSHYPDGRHIGTAGLVGSFSFSAPKIISTGQGGAIVTNDDKVADKLRRLKDFGRSGGGNDIHDSIGYNFKFTELQACIGIEQMKKLPAFLRQSLTYDRGSEMARHAELAERLNIDIWFADPYAPWQRGSNENINGLIRQYLPKGTDLSVHSQEELDAIALQLNMRPRKRFDFKCPIEVMGEVMQNAMAMRHDAPVSIQ